MNKKKSQQAHARKRAFERYGITHSEKSEHDIIQQIQTQKGTFVKKQSLRISVWLVTLKDGSKSKVVYDKTNQTIVTFLPTTPEEILALTPKPKDNTIT